MESRKDLGEVILELSDVDREVRTRRTLELFNLLSKIEVLSENDHQSPRSRAMRPEAVDALIHAISTLEPVRANNRKKRRCLTGASS